MAKMPKAQPSPKAARTISTIGARQAWLKNQWMVAPRGC
jgi:hypothetical protein